MRVILANRTTGRITVNGWDRDVIEAHAVSERGEEVVLVARKQDRRDNRLFLKADYADLDQPADPTNRLLLRLLSMVSQSKSIWKLVCHAMPRST